jgi:hypothetical protein
MLPRTLSTLALFAAAALAQQPTPAPKKDPFANFGSSLDKKPAGPRTMPVPPPAQNTPPATAPPPAAPIAPPSSSGLALATDWEKHVTESTGGQTRKIDDLSALLSAYGTASADTAAHPDVTVYEGPAIDRPGDCRIAYLTPLAAAEQALFSKDHGISSVMKAVAPGFPDGLSIHSYDVKAGIYNRLYIVTDYSKVQQVVCLVLKAENLHWIPASPPFVKIERDWHTFDYVNTMNRGQPKMIIDTRVNDLRKRGHFIIANSSGSNGVHPKNILPPGIVEKPAGGTVNETATWYAPEPLINLILYCISRQNR